MKKFMKGYGRLIISIVFGVVASLMVGKVIGLALGIIIWLRIGWDLRNL